MRSALLTGPGSAPEAPHDDLANLFTEAELALWDEATGEAGDNGTLTHLGASMLADTAPNPRRDAWAHEETVVLGIRVPQGGATAPGPSTRFDLAGYLAGVQRAHSGAPSEPVLVDSDEPVSPLGAPPVGYRRGPSDRGDGRGLTDADFELIERVLGGLRRL